MNSVGGAAEHAELLKRSFSRDAVRYGGGEAIIRVLRVVSRMIVERTLGRNPYWLKLQRGCFCVQWLNAMSCSTLERDEVQVEDATNQNRQKVVDVSALQVSLL